LRVYESLDKMPGIHTESAEQARKRIDEGFRFVALSSDIKIMRTAFKNHFESLGRR